MSDNPIFKLKPPVSTPKRDKIMRQIRQGKKGKPTNEERDLIDDLMLDPRQKTAWANYIDPKSPTFMNAMRSCINAGYKESYALSITTRPWWANKLRRASLLTKAERVFDKALQMETADKDTGKEQADLLRIQADVAKHISKTLGKDEGYSERSEMTGKDGQPMVFMPAELYDKYSLGQPINNNK